MGWSRPMFIRQCVNPDQLNVYKTKWKFKYENKAATSAGQWEVKGTSRMYTTKILMYIFPFIIFIKYLKFTYWQKNCHSN